MEHPVFRSTFHKYRKIFRALLARTILAAHSVLTIYHTVQLKNDERYYALFCWLAPMTLLETGIILYLRQGCEWKKICTSFIVYLLSVVPALWIQRLHITENHGNETTAGSASENFTLLQNLPVNIGLSRQDQIRVRDILDSIDWTKFLEQSMMFVLILCRWVLPRGHIDRNSMSQLLIMYSAISADILDFSDVFQLKEIQTNYAFMLIGLSVWSWSMVQFTLVVTTAFGFRRKTSLQESQTTTAADSWDRSEVVSILMVFFMQDGPFLIVRLYAILYIQLSDYYTIFFFSLKNILTLILGFYRLMVLFRCISREGNDLLTMEEIAKSKESLATIESEIGTSKKNRAKLKKSKSKESLETVKSGTKKKKHKNNLYKY